MKTSYFNNFELELPDEAVEDCSHQGECIHDCEFWEPYVTFPDAEAIRKELHEYGAWDDEELKNNKENRLRLLWIAACGIKEEEYEAKRNET